MLENLVLPDSRALPGHGGNDWRWDRCAPYWLCFVLLHTELDRCNSAVNRHAMGLWVQVSNRVKVAIENPAMNSKKRLQQ